MPSKENITKRLNGCIWTEQAERWLPMDRWDACPSEPIDPARLKGLPCMMAIDGASTNDFFSSCLLFGPDDGGFYAAIWRFWLPESSLAEDTSPRPEAVRLQLREWADRGWITLTPGDVVDYDLIEEQLLEDAEQHDVRKIPFDRWNVTQLITHLRDKMGDDTREAKERKVWDFPQSMAQMSAPSKELEKVLAAGRLRHGGNPVARWMASNVTVKHGPNAQIKPDREKSGDKIDGIITLVMALDMATRHPDGGESVYDQRHAAGQEVVDSW